MLDWLPCSVGGFSSIGTRQDYGKGIVRLNHRLSKQVGGGEMMRRGKLVRIETRNHDRIFRLVRHNNTGNDFALYLEYDDRQMLGLGSKTEAELQIRPAYRVEYLLFLWGHTDPIVSIEFKLTLILSGLSLLLGTLVGLIV